MLKNRSMYRGIRTRFVVWLAKRYSSLFLINNRLSSYSKCCISVSKPFALPNSFEITARLENKLKTYLVITLAIFSFNRSKTTNSCQRQTTLSFTQNKQITINSHQLIRSNEKITSFWTKNNSYTPGHIGYSTTLLEVLSKYWEWESELKMKYYPVPVCH